jgi:hypothetical protein
MHEEFPDDENGDVLRRMKADGDDFDKPRNIDFTVVFATEIAAQQFASHFRELGHKVWVNRSGCVPDLPWDVLVVKFMLPSHQSISEFEEILEFSAVPLGGRNDGWGCIRQAVEH